MEHRLAASIRAVNAEISPLLALPGELRNHIYRDVLLDIQIHIHLPAIHQSTGLLRTCSQLREEAASILYEEGTFVITDPNAQYRDVQRFLTGLGFEDARQLQHVMLQPTVPGEWPLVIHNILRHAPDSVPTFRREKYLATQRQTVQDAESRIVRGYYSVFQGIASNLFQAAVKLSSIETEERFHWILRSRAHPIATGRELVRMINQYFMEIVQSEWRAMKKDGA